MIFNIQTRISQNFEPFNFEYSLFLGFGSQFDQFLHQVLAVPASNGIFHQSAAVGGNILHLYIADKRRIFDSDEFN